MKRLWLLLLLSLSDCRAGGRAQCGGRLTETRGLIQTPGFPAPFPVPIKCQWIIEASDMNDVSIVVYLTQLYVLKGLKFTEYALYGMKMGERLIHTVTDQNVTKVRWIETHRPVLVVEFQMNELEGNQLRALDGLLDVYGFNITYEISTQSEPVRPRSCIVVDCSFVGHCYVSSDYTNFECACFKGFHGPNCGYGPHCARDRSVCQNGATCSHLGAEAVTCHCPPGFTGDNCGILEELGHDDKGCGEHGCVSQCDFDGRPENVCKCPAGSTAPADRARYEGTIRLANLPAPRESGAGPSRTLEGYIERQIVKFLKNSNISKMDDVRVLNITPGAEVTFHFFGAKKDGSEVRDTLNRLVRRGRCGNLTLVPTYLAFRQEPTLLLQSVKVNQDGKRKIREGDEFIISCEAQGSTHMTFRWYKDGIFVNTTKAIRDIWAHLIKSSDFSDQYTARLGIGKATSLDEGVYTCQIEDWGVQQCKSVHIEVRLPPEVRVSPKSLTVQKGENVSIVCMSPNDRHHETFGYNWTKNKQLFKAATEFWEELYPAGSILKITNIQQSAWYSCEVIGGYVTTTVDVRVEVLNRTVVPVCPQETTAGISWPETSPGVHSVQQCPMRFVGDARRLCTMRSERRPEWDLPDFASCLSETLLVIHNNFRRLTFGYQNTTGAVTLESYASYLDRRAALFPREGEHILNLVDQVVNYINRTNSSDEVENATRSFFHIVDRLLRQENSITDVTKIAELQRMVRSQASVSVQPLKSDEESHQILDTLVIDSVTLNTTSFHNLHFPLRGNSYPSWFADKLDVRIESSGTEPFGNGSFSVTACVYKNLSLFLPERSVARLKDGHDCQFEILSHLVSLSFGRDGRTFAPPRGTLWLDLELQHAPSNYSNDIWNTTCAVADVAGSGHHWDLDSCILQFSNETVTKCSCTKTGTYAVLLTTRPTHMARASAHSYQFEVLLGCMCCLIQASIALLVLVLYWWHHRSSLAYLKVQCCGATVGAMAVFLYVLCDDPPSESFSYITTCLETFFLIGMSSHLSKILIVYTELVQMSRVRRLKPTVVGIITGVPVIAVFGNHLAHRSIGRSFESWWLITGTLVFNIFVISALVMVVLFLFLYFSVMRKLHLLANKHMTNSRALDRRIGLLRRAAAIFLSMVLMEIASILYINVPTVACHYIFSLSCAIFGLLLLLCYVIKSETTLRTILTKKLKLDKNSEDFSSDSANSPLSFFHKQEPDAESESAPPRQIRGKLSGLDCTEGLLLSDSQSKIRYPPSEGAPSTIETYLHSISEDSVERYEIEQRPDGNEDVGLELYNSSPKKYRKSPINAALFSESEAKYPEHWYVRGHPDSIIISPSSGQFLRDMQHPPDILTTRVCLELGLVPSNSIIGTEANILVEAPSIMLCSVDVEPCEAIELAGAEAKCNGDAATDEPEPIKRAQDAKPEPESERKQPEGREKVFPESETPENDDNLDGMLDRISHDLDYLLNRTVPEIQVTPATSSHRKTSKPPASSVRGQIKEEEEPEPEEEDAGNDKDVAKTAC